MKPATRPPERRDSARLLAIDPRTGANRDLALIDLPELLSPGDLLVVNDAATLPASLRGTLNGSPVELRLLAHRGQSRWAAVLFGPGDWRTATEHRIAPPIAVTGDHIELGSDLRASVKTVSARSHRLLELELCADRDVLEQLYEIGRPVQYAHAKQPLDLWSVQTAYASRPWAVEMPSAGYPLSWSVLESLRRRRVEIARVTHAAGLSSTGDPVIDAVLPLPERYDIPAATVDAVEGTHALGGRVIAVGTTVVRALEGAAVDRALEGAAVAGALVAGEGITDLRIDGHHRLRVVDGVLTGMHDPAESHFALLRAFADSDVLFSSWSHAVAQGYRCHEFGDATLLLPSRRRESCSVSS